MTKACPRSAPADAPAVLAPHVPHVRVVHRLAVGVGERATVLAKALAAVARTSVCAVADRAGTLACLAHIPLTASCVPTIVVGERGAVQPRVDRCTVLRG